MVGFSYDSARRSVIPACGDRGDSAPDLRRCAWHSLPLSNLVTRWAVHLFRTQRPSVLPTWDIWRLRPSGAELERLTFHHARVTYPVLLDARTLLYLATDADGSGPWLYVLDVALKRSRRVSVGLERYTSLAANEDRTRLLATVTDFRSDLWRVTVGSGGPPQGTAERIAPVSQSASAPRFGPGYIAYVSSGGARRGIWKYANGTATELWSDATVDRVGAPSISPDGRRIAFAVERGGETQLYTVDSPTARNSKVFTRTLALTGDLALGLRIRSQSWKRDRERRRAAARKDLLGAAPPQPIVSDYSDRSSVVA